MKRHLGTSLIASLAVLVFGLCSTNASAQTVIHLEDFTVNQTPLFDFGAFAGNTSFSPLGLLTNIPASADSFGGIGVAPLAPVDLTGTTSIELTAQVEPGNMSAIVVSIREAADAAGVIGEFFSFTVPASAFAGGGFQTVSIDPTSGFNGDTTNGILDGPLDNSGVQTPFGGVDSQSFTVQSIAFLGDAPAVPEPGSLVALLSLGTVAALRRRRA